MDFSFLIKSPSTHFWCNWKQATIPTSSPGGSRRATDSFLGQFGKVCKIVFLCSNSSVFVSPKLIFSWEMAKHIFFFFGQSRTFFDWSRTFFDRSRTYLDRSRTFSIGVELFAKFYSNGKKFYSDRKKFYCTPKKVLNFGIFRWTWVLKSIYGAVNFGCWRSTKGEWERDECSTSALLYLRLLMSDGGVTYQGRYAVNVGADQPCSPSSHHTKP